MSHPRKPRPGAVSRALASDRLGVPAVLFFVLAGVAPPMVAVILHSPGRDTPG